MTVRKQFHSNSATTANVASSAQSLTFTVPREQVALVTANFLWMADEWLESPSANPDLVKVTVTLAEDGLELPEFAWLLSSLPGCMDAAFEVAPSAAFDGRPVRDVADLETPPSEDVINRCLDGVTQYQAMVGIQANLTEMAAALLQFGLDIRESMACGDHERAEHWRRQSRIYRGCIAATLFKKLRGNQ